jgi:hypothetical protein
LEKNGTVAIQLRLKIDLRYKITLENYGGHLKMGVSNNAD